MSMHSSERHANDSAKLTGNLLKKQGKVVKLRKPISTTRGDRLIGQLRHTILAKMQQMQQALQVQEMMLYIGRNQMHEKKK